MNSDIKIYSLLVSKYENTFSKFPKTMTLGESLKEIQDGVYQKEIIECRRLVKEGKIIDYKKVKAKLPVITYCGTFNGAHSKENISNYNNLMIIDIDYVNGDLIEIKRNIFNDPHILSCWISPSGRGIKCLMKIKSEIDKHKLMFDSLADYFKLNHSVEIDKSGSDVSRLCYVSFDPELLSKIECDSFKLSNIDNLEIAFEATSLEKENITNTKPASNNSNRATRFKSISSDNVLFHKTEGRNNSRDRDTISKIIRYLKKNNKSITSNYDNWYRVGMAIANTFTFEIGFKYYLELCRLDGPLHDEYKSANILDYCYRRRKLEGIKFATIIFLAKENGFVN